MSRLREAAQQALEALDGVEALLTSMDVTHLLVYEEVNNAITALKAALAEPVQGQAEPVQETVAWQWQRSETGRASVVGPFWGPLYLSSPQRPAEPVQEPVGWFESPQGDFRTNPLYKMEFPSSLLKWQIPLFITPPQRKPLMDEQIDAISQNLWIGGNWKHYRLFARVIERAHGIGGEK